MCVTWRKLKKKKMKQATTIGNSNRHSKTQNCMNKIHTSETDFSEATDGFS